MAATSPSKPAQRLLPLDSLRGLAAMSVVLHHTLISIPLLYELHFINLFYAWNPDDAARRALTVFAYTPLHAIWAGNEAVMLFFVLSGFVLALPFLEGRRPRYGAFLLRRFCRIYLPYAAALLAAWGLSLAIPHHGFPGLSAWFLTIWNRPIDGAIALDQALMLGNPQANILDNPTWSLIHEMRVSIGFPLLALIAAPAGVLGSLGLFALSVLGLTPQLCWPLRLLPATLVDTCVYAAFFLWGVLLAKHRHQLGAWIARRGRGGKALLWSVALACYTFDWWRWLPECMRRGAFGFVCTQIPPLPDCHNATLEVVALGAGMIIVLALNTTHAERVLMHPALRWLGKVSYSLYLVHVPLLAALAYTLGRFLPGIWFLVLVPPLALACAGVFHDAIEQPAIVLGYRLSGKKPASELPQKPAAAA